jgi:hypothetical protein
MTSKTRVRSGGQSSVFTAVITALAIIATIAAIAVSWPMIKSTYDKNYWSGSMGLYTLKFTNSTYAYAQNGVGAKIGSNPSPIGYCITLSINSSYAVSTCPSTTPSYQPLPCCGGGGSGSGGGGGGGNYYVYVTVTGDSYGAGWEISSSAASISGTNNVNNQQLPIGGQTDTLIARITSNPSGYTCTITPTSEQVSAGNSYTFTVSCQQQLPSPITVTVNDPYNAGWQISWSGAASGSQSGSSSATFTVQPTSNGAITFTAKITNNPSGYTCTISPQSTTAKPGQSVSFTVSCQQQPQPQLTLIGPKTLWQGTTTAKYTLTWNVAPGSATQVSWSVSESGQSAFTVTATLTYTENGDTYQAIASMQTTLSCLFGTPVIYSIQIKPTSQPVSGSSGSATATVYINWQCRLW